MNGSLLALGAAGALALGAAAFPRGSRDLQATRTLSGTHLSRARIAAWDPDHAKTARDAGRGFTVAYRGPLLGHGLYAFLDGHAPPGGPPGNPGDWVANPVTVTGRVLDLTQRVSPEEANAWIAWHLAQRTERMSPLRHLYGGVKVKNREPVEGEALFWSLKGHLGIRWTEEMTALGYAAVLFPCNPHGNFSESSRANVFVSFFVGDPSLVSWGPVGTGAGTANRATPKTAAFGRWFGDSKVVDASGAPRVVYHGGLVPQHPSSHDPGTGIEIFHGAREPFSRPAVRGGAFVGVGSFFSESADVAASYPTGGIRYVGPPPYGPNSPVSHARTVYPVYLAIARPKAYTTARKAADDMLARSGSPVSFVRQLQAEGYDGITYLEGPGHAPKTNKARVWVAFEPTQVKSASGNSGAFDPADPRISANRTGRKAKPAARRPDDPVPTMVLPAGTLLYHGTAHPRRFEEAGSSVFTSPFWVSRDPRVARMIALDDADEDDRPPRIFHLRTTRDIGPLAVLKTDQDIADLVADVRDEPRERVQPGSLGSYQLARILARESHPGWVAPGNYGSSRSIFSYGEAPVCRPSKPTCDDICLCLSEDVASLDLFRVEVVPAVEVQARRGHLR